MMSMGITYIEGTVTGPTGESSKVEFLIDSGATYSLVPPEVGPSRRPNRKRTGQLL